MNTPAVFRCHQIPLRGTMVSDEIASEVGINVRIPVLSIIEIISNSISSQLFIDVGEIFGD